MMNTAPLGSLVSHLLLATELQWTEPDHAHEGRHGVFANGKSNRRPR